MIECLKSLYRINYPNHDAIRLHQPDDVIDSTFSLSNSERNMGKFLRLLHKRKYVDVVVPAEELVKYFGAESFDVVIATELLEHVKDWRLVVNNMKQVLKPKGYIYYNSF